MSQSSSGTYKRSLFSLPVRIITGLIFAAVLPLIIMLGYIWFQTRPALVDQANNVMKSDAQTRVQLINTYFTERILDAQTLTQVPSVQTFLVLPYAPEDPGYIEELKHAGYALKAGIDRDKNYANWALFDKDGQLRSSYPTQPVKHGKTFFSKQQLQRVLKGQTYISPVYYSSQSEKSSVDIYAPVYSLAPGSKVVVGFLRSTLNLDYIYRDVVQKDLASNGKGSYAFILDENGVRVADTDPSRLFTSVKGLPTEVQQQINDELRYSDKSSVRLLEDAAIADLQTAQTQTASIQTRPAGQEEDYQVVQHSVTTVPWQYYVLSPVSTVTNVAYQQLIYALIIALFASLAVAIIGLFVGRGISRPIMQAVEYLRSNTESLSTLATSQQEAATEQVWVVDSSQVGLQSVQYYTEATKVASTQLRETALELIQSWNRQNGTQIENALQRIIQAAQYIENATDYQQTSNQKLATALKVATQVTEQLHLGATSATEAATQLELVVDELRTVVGR